MLKDSVFRWVILVMVISFIFREHTNTLILAVLVMQSATFYAIYRVALVYIERSK